MFGPDHNRDRHRADATRDLPSDRVASAPTLPTDAEIDELEAAGCDERMIQRIVDQRFAQWEAHRRQGDVS